MAETDDSDHAGPPGQAGWAKLGLLVGSGLFTSGAAQLANAPTSAAVLMMIVGAAVLALTSLPILDASRRHAGRVAGMPAPPRPRRAPPGGRRTPAGGPVAWRQGVAPVGLIFVGALLGLAGAAFAWPRGGGGPEPAARPCGPARPVAPAPSEPATAGPAAPSVRMFRGDPARAGIHPGPGPPRDLPPAVLRRREIVGLPISSSPAVVGGIVYVGVGQHLYAWNPANDHVDWTGRTYGPVESSPAVAAARVDGRLVDVLYVGSNDGHLYAFRRDSGEQVWRAPARAKVFSSPVVVDGVVYVGSGTDRELGDDEREGFVLGLDAQTGRERWCFAVGEPVLSSPAVANGKVYVAAWDRKVYALDAATGKEVWSTPKTESSLVASPAVVDGVVYVGNYEGYVHALDAETGESRWRSDEIPVGAGMGVYASAAVANGKVYVARFDGSLYALGAESGDVLWAVPLHGWDDEAKAGIRSSPTVAAGVVYVGSDNGYLYAVDAEQGKPLWNLNLGGTVRSSPAVVGGVVYAATMPGVLYAIGASPGAGTAMGNARS